MFREPAVVPAMGKSSDEGDGHQEGVLPVFRPTPDIRSVGLFRGPIPRHPAPNPWVRLILERRIRIWRAEHGPRREVIFSQRHGPGPTSAVELRN